MIRNTASRLFRYLMLERPAGSRSLGELAATLQASGEELARRFAGAEGSDKNREKLRHIISIERWGQRRLRVGLGETFVADESRAYKPAPDTEWSALQGEFSKTRGETLELADRLSQEGVDPTMTVPHNQFGPLTLRGWLRYLETHASFEGKRIR